MKERPRTTGATRWRTLWPRKRPSAAIRAFVANLEKGTNMYIWESSYPYVVCYNKGYGYAIVISKESDAKTITYLGAKDTERLGKLDVLKMKRGTFEKAVPFLAVEWEGRRYLPERALGERFGLGTRRISSAALPYVEEIMDTRGKSSKEIREECARLAKQLPKGHALANVPAQYADRSEAIAAYTAIRGALYAAGKLNETTPQEQTQMNETTTTSPSATPPETTAAKKASGKKATPATKKASGKKTATPAPAPAAKKASGKKATPAPAAKKASGKKGKSEASALAAAAAKGGRPRQNLDGAYVLKGDALKVKTTEELGMHEESIRTKVLNVILSSKAKGGVPFATLEKTAGDKTRGAIQYLLKRGFIGVAA